MIFERVLTDTILASKQKESERKKELSPFWENAKASTEGLHEHALPEKGNKAGEGSRAQVL